jgi:hypothetical protein
VDLKGITKWAYGVTLGPATAIDNKVEATFKSDWWRIGAAAVPICKDCGVVIAGKNGLKSHRNLHQQVIDLQEDLAYLYEYLEIGDGDGNSEDTSTDATGSGGAVHDAG